MSIYASIPGVGAEDDDPEAGQPWRYLGSHILPAEEDPRGGSIGLALIPSHITRDGRDGQPEDGAPWPWLRLSLDGCDHNRVLDPTLILNPVQARRLAEQLSAWADSVGHGTHRYLSTGCLHGEHAYCQAKTGRVGAKEPAKCKFCDARCQCGCHRATP